MTALTLRFATKSSERFDLSALTPERLKGMKQKAIEALPIGITRDPAKVGDVFKLKGDDPAKLRLIGTSRVCDNIGRGMKDGEIVVDGDAGAYLGATMRGGKISVSGSTGPYAGGSMARRPHRHRGKRRRARRRRGGRRAFRHARRQAHDRRQCRRRARRAHAARTCRRRAARLPTMPARA